MKNINFYPDILRIQFNIIKHKLIKNITLLKKTFLSHKFHIDIINLNGIFILRKN